MSSGNGINMYWNQARKVTGAPEMAESLLQGGAEEPGNKMSFSFNQGENKGSMSMVSSASANQQLASITRQSRAKKREEAAKGSPVPGCITVTIAIVISRSLTSSRSSDSPKESCLLLAHTT